MNKIKVFVNYQHEHVLQVPYLLEKAFRALPNVEYTDIEPDIVVNSMPYNGIIRGKHKTCYWELDAVEKIVPEAYDVDIVYYPGNVRKEVWTEKSKILLMAVDPEFYHPFDVPLEYDCLFIGRNDRDYRENYINNLKEKINASMGTAERGMPSAKLLSSAKCSFQISQFENLEQRNFEYSAVVPMVLERVEDISMLGKEDEHYKGFTRGHYYEFEQQILWCVNNREEALKMRDRMIENLLKNHTYKNRALQILEDLKYDESSILN